jgi:hypothetical protein
MGDVYTFIAFIICDFVTLIPHALIPIILYFIPRYHGGSHHSILNVKIQLYRYIQCYLKGEQVNTLSQLIIMWRKKLII